MKHALATLGLSAIAAAALVTAASAGDRRATPEEQAQVGAILQANGFTSWQKIEYDDDGKFEVDDARHANGRVYDVDIRGGRIVKKERD